MFEEYIAIKKEMELVYLHDQRPWMIGYSGGKDSTLLCQLVFEMLESLPEENRWKPVYIVTSDTMVENPIVKTYMHKMSKAINEASTAKNLNVQAHIIYPEIRQTFWSLMIGLDVYKRQISMNPLHPLNVLYQLTLLEEESVGEVQIGRAHV